MFQSAELQSSRLSPRTAKYVEARIREGDDFDYRRWLQRVREEEARANQVPAAFSSSEVVAPELGDLTNTLDRLDAWANAEPALAGKTAPIPGAAYRSSQKATGESPRDRLRRKLMRVSDAFDEFQESRVRGAVYEYLKAVFAVVVDHRGRGRTKRLLRPRTRIHSPVLFAAHLNVTLTIRRSANGRGRYGMLLIARGPRRR